MFKFIKEFIDQVFEDPQKSDPCMGKSLSYVRPEPTTERPVIGPIRMSPNAIDPDSKSEIIKKFYNIIENPSYNTLSKEDNEYLKKLLEKIGWNIERLEESK